MRIIKEGVLPETVEHEKTCLKCKTVFAYTSADVHSDQRDGPYVKCPLCKSYISTQRSGMIDGH